MARGERSRDSPEATAAGLTPLASRQRAAAASSTPLNGRTPLGRSKSSMAGTPVGPLPTFVRPRTGRGQSRSEPTSPRGASRPSSLADSEPASLAELLADEEGSRTADNVRVLVRVRPLNERERQESGSCASLSVSGQAVMLTDPNRGEPFVKCFDTVFGPEATQEEVHQVAGVTAVQHTMQGYNASIFAYGQTGSGKTHTMQGEDATLRREEDGGLPAGCGLIPRVFDLLFARISEEEQDNPGLRYSVKCSFLEVYNEEISDLLQPSNSRLQIRDGDLAKGVFVDGLTERSVLNADDVMELMVQGSASRHVAATRMNERSSRSHSVFTAHITRAEKTESGLTNVRYSKLNLIDLAGSERVGKSGATGDQLAEAKNINKSLTVLGRVISALVERQRRPHVHVPYRDSRLTFLLQESLGGNSRSCIIANVSPAPDCAQETYSTLVFAAGAKRIRNHAVVNCDTLGDMKALQLENARLQRLLAEAQSSQAAAAESAALAQAHEKISELEDALARAQQEADTQALLFDQNNQEIQTLKLHSGLVVKELAAEKASSGQLRDERAQLQLDNASLQERAAALETELSRMAREAESRGEAARAAEREREALEAELRKAQREAADAAEHASGVQARLQAENEELYAATQGLRRELEHARTQLSSETVAVAKYKRMVGEITKLIDWASTQSSVRSGSPGGMGVAALRSTYSCGRPSPLGGSGGSGVENMLAAVEAAMTPQSAGGRAASPGKWATGLLSPAQQQRHQQHTPLSPNKVR